MLMLISNNDIIFLNKDSNNVTFSSYDKGILSADINKINFVNVNFDKDDPETITHVRRLACDDRFKQCKAFKKDVSKEEIPVWDPTRQLNWFMPEDEKKEIKLRLIDEKQYKVAGIV